MRWFGVAIFLLMFATYAKADVAYQLAGQIKNTPVRKTVEAYLATKDMTRARAKINNYVKNLENKALKFLSLDRKTLALIGASAAIVVDKRIDTSKIGIHFRFLGGVASPKFYYDFRSRVGSGSITFKWNI